MGDGNLPMMDPKHLGMRQTHVLVPALPLTNGVV